MFFNVFFSLLTKKQCFSKKTPEPHIIHERPSQMSRAPHEARRTAKELNVVQKSECG